MSRFTRYPSTPRRSDTPHYRGREKHLEAAERLFNDVPTRPDTPFERTNQAAKQITQDAATERRTLTEALRAARIERAGRFGK